MRLATEAASVAAYEADVAILRELRMALRDVTTKLLVERRWRAFAEPVTPEDDPEFWHRVRCRRHAAREVGKLRPAMTMIARHIKLYMGAPSAFADSDDMTACAQGVGLECGSNKHHKVH